MNTRRFRLTVFVSLCTLATLLSYGSSVQAAVTHNFLFDISEVPSEGPKGEAVPVPGPLVAPRAMTVDSGHLWVSEYIEGVGGFRVDEFDASTGAFISQLPQPGSSLSYFDQGLAVGHTTGETELYVGADAYPAGSPEGAVAVYNAANELQAVWSGADTPQGSFGCFECGFPGDVAVDDSTSLGDWATGDVFVSAPLQGVVDVFKPEAGGKEKYVTQLTGPEAGVPFEGINNIAVSALNGDVLVSDGAAVDVFEPTALDEYTLVRRITETPQGAFKPRLYVVADGASGDVYLNELEREPGIVYQFDAEGNYLGRLTGAGSPKGDFVNVYTLAADPVSKDVYVGDRRPETNSGEKSGGFVHVFGPNIVIPDVTTEAATSVAPHSATLNGIVNPRKAGSATCRFLWGTSGSFGQVAPCPTPVAEGESNVPVSAAIEGLQPDTTYYYRLQATNPNGTNPGEEGQDRQFTTPGPGMSGTSSASVSSTSATLNAAIDPHGAPTTYYFQYGTSSAYEASIPAPPGASVGAGETSVEVDQHVQGLSAHTVYHYRVVALSEVAPGAAEGFDGPDETFVTQPGGGALTLPDGRAWEQVSPVDKHGARIDEIGNKRREELTVQAAANGNAMTYFAAQPTEANPQGLVDGVQVLSRRDAHGWTSLDLSTPNEQPAPFEPNQVGYVAFSADLSIGYVRPNGEKAPLLSPLASEPTAYLRRQTLCEDEATAGECYLPLVTGKEGYADVPPGTPFGEEGGLKNKAITHLEGETPDFAHIVFREEKPVALTSKPAGAEGLYEWSGDKPPAERLQLISVLPEDEGGQWVPALLGGKSIYGSIKRRAITQDGSRIFWTEAEDNTKHLYLRDLAKGESLRIDARESGVQGPAVGGFNNAAFQFMTDDGADVYFTDGERLTNDSGARADLPDLYECEIVEEAGKLACRLRDLTPRTATGERAGLRDLTLGGGENGSYVYFVANGVLAEGASRGDCSEDAGREEIEAQECNLYVLHGGTTSLVATLSDMDMTDWAGVQNTRGNLPLSTARTSPDGRYLAFMSLRPLTGYDNRDVHTGKRVEEVFLYDAQTGHLACASCNPTGARPVGVSEEQSTVPLVKTVLDTDVPFAGYIPAWTNERYQSDYLSNSGRLFFDGTDALVPQDINGTIDVYEFEPAGVGDCTPSSATFDPGSGGCAGLISSGSSTEESAFLDASANGDDVFFLTTEKLVLGDVDSSLDVYDAHVCTAELPCTSASASTPPCATADACRAAPSVQPPIFGSPASATFAGAGNVSQTGPPSTVKPRSLTRAQKLARALHSCHRKRRRKQRAGCERQARRRYGTSHTGKATKRGKG